MTGIIAAAGITAAAGLAGGLLSRSGGSSGGTQTQTARRPSCPTGSITRRCNNYGDATRPSYSLMRPTQASASLTCRPA